LRVCGDGQMAWVLAGERNRATPSLSEQQTKTPIPT
jgi:hypothetical protein